MDYGGVLNSTGTSINYTSAIISDESSGPLNGTIIASTALNQNRNQFNTSAPNFVITQNILNEMLQNVTLSLMNNVGIWMTEVNATQSNFRNVYSFSNRLNLLLPYYISLLVTFPLLAVGFISLHQNGVSATDGGFLQILTTTSTSATLHHAAAAEVFAFEGDKNIPEELKKLKVMFGELEGERAGFGCEGEVMGVRKGARCKPGLEDPLATPEEKI